MQMICFVRSSLQCPSIFRNFRQELFLPKILLESDFFQMRGFRGYFLTGRCKIPLNSKTDRMGEAAQKPYAPIAKSKKLPLGRQFK